MPYAAPDNLKRHALSTIFGDMDDDEFEELAVSIEKEGQRHAITVFEGAVLDGWHRYRACQMLGLECKAVDYPGDLDPVAYVTRENLNRRSLSAAQRAVIRWALQQISAERAAATAAAQVDNAATSATAATEPKKRGSPSIWGGRQKEIAAETGVSVRTLRRAAKAVSEGRAKAVMGKGATIVEPRKKKSPSPPALPQDAAVAAKVSQLEDTVANLTSELEAAAVHPDDVQVELKRLNAENAQLRDQVGVWQQKHAEAVAKIKRLEGALRKYESA